MFREGHEVQTKGDNASQPGLEEVQDVGLACGGGTHTLGGGLMSLLLMVLVAGAHDSVHSSFHGSTHTGTVTATSFFSCLIIECLGRTDLLLHDITKGPSKAKEGRYMIWQTPLLSQIRLPQAFFTLSECESEINFRRGDQRDLQKM